MKKIISLVLCLVLCLSLCTAAFAEVPYVAEADAAKAGIVKVLDISDQITDPGMTFTFNFTPVDSADNCTGTAFSKTITSTAMTVYGNQKAGKISFADMGFMSAGIDHAGVWAWTVTESAAVAGFSGSPLTKTTTSGNITITDTLTLDTNSYIVRVDVVNGTDGTPAIAGYTVEKAGDKVNPAFREDVPGVPGTEGTAGQTRLGSGFEFENKLTEKQEGDETDGVFNVSKTVATKDSATNDRGDNTKPFKFTLKLTDHSVGTGTASTMTSVTAKITRDTAQPIAQDAPVNEITINIGGSAEFYLSNGDKLVIKEMPVGVSWELEETNYSSEKYTSSLTDNKASGAIATGVTAANAVTNTFEPQPITGIVVNNLPFVLIVLLAVSGIAVYFVINRRREQED